LRISTGGRTSESERSLFGITEMEQGPELPEQSIAKILQFWSIQISSESEFQFRNLKSLFKVGKKV
jgi:hypothetical protein